MPLWWWAPGDPEGWVRELLPWWGQQSLDVGPLARPRKSRPGVVSPDRGCRRAKEPLRLGRGAVVGGRASEALAAANGGVRWGGWTVGPCRHHGVPSPWRLDRRQRCLGRPAGDQALRTSGNRAGATWQPFRCRVGADQQGVAEAAWPMGGSGHRPGSREATPPGSEPPGPLLQ